VVDYEAIIDDIRTVLMADKDPSEDALRALDERYAEAVNDVNERLRICDALLNRGHRSEAIQKAEVEPKLLDVVTILDFPEHGVWSDYLKQFGLPGAPVVSSEAAEQLNDAYNEDASLGELLRANRRHALMRSPLRTRLTIVRRIAQRDPGNPIWHEDTCSYERVRHNELANELNAAVKRRDAQVLADLEQEVRSDAWIQAPPADIVNRIVQAHTQVRAGRARERLAELAEELTNAHSNFDVAEGRALRSQWLAQSRLAFQQDNDPLEELAAPALEWLAEQDRKDQEVADYKSTVAEVKRALDDWEPRQTLEPLYYKLATFEELMEDDREASDQLLRRVAERFEVLEVQSQRRARLFSVAAVLTVLLVGGFITWGIYAYTQGRVRSRHVASITALLESKSIREAEAYLQTLENEAPGIYESAEIKGLHAQLHDLIQHESGRKQQLSTLIAAALELGQQWETYNQAKERLEEAEQVAETESEHAEIARARKDIEATHTAMQNEYNLKFDEELDVMLTKLSDVDETDLNALDELIATGERLEDFFRASHDRRALLPDVLKRLRAMRSTEMQQRREDEMLQDVYAAATSPARFKAAIERYADQFNESALAVSLKKLVETEAPLWRALGAWSQFAKRWANREFERIEPSTAAEFLRKLEELEQAEPKLPLPDSFNRLKPHLAAVAKRYDADGQLTYRGLEPQLTSYARYHMAAVKRGSVLKRYYFPQQDVPKALGNKLTFYCFVDLNDQDTKRVTLDVNHIVNPIADEGSVSAADRFDWESPQARWGQYAGQSHLSDRN